MVRGLRVGPKMKKKSDMKALETILETTKSGRQNKARSNAVQGSNTFSPRKAFLMTIFTVQATHVTLMSYVTTFTE
jgi:hypothetical protein